ncbi:MAG: glycosyltransferase family 4 protein [Paracoccus denitrificans]|uniref:Glycosyltransferase family 4 protein n=1 Tax=Paracoccus denitrificans TaxID=266 RepID=A0A533I770_PARDE|nr:MAG: glycosyltransferase family 4 protein [Paracoccus denitrificans]
MDRIRILYPFAGDTGLGGSHVSALGLIRGLDPDRFEPRILIHRQAGAVGEYFRDMGLAIEVVPDLPLMRTPNYPREGDIRPAGYFLRLVPRLMKEMRRINPQIVHTNEGRLHTNWSIPTRLSGRKHLWHHRQDPRAFGINKLAPLTASRIVSVSQFALPVKPVRPIAGRYDIVRSPFDFSAPLPDNAAARQMILEQLSLPQDTLLLGWFGTLVERKKPVRFVEAVAEIQQAIPDRPVHGLLFGGSDEADPTQRQQCLDMAAARGITDRIHMMGFRNPIQDYMAGVDFYLVTAINEPFGRTLIEAMHLGTLVIATEHGGNPEAITDGMNGFLVPPEDPHAFVAPVIALATDPAQMQKVVDTARAHVLANYGQEVHVRQISRIYAQLAGAAQP